MWGTVRVVSAVPGRLLMNMPRRAFDLASREPGEGTPTKDFRRLLTEMAENCDYSLNKQAEDWN